MAVLRVARRRVRHVPRRASPCSAVVRSRCGRRSSVAAAVQLVPLASPLLLSTDAWTYWGYGWIAAEAGGNPYVDAPASFPASPADPHLGADWRDTTSVYGPAFTLLTEPIARISGTSADAAAWIFKGLAAVSVLVATVAVSRSSRRPALAAAFVGWNPVLAVHAGGGGHNDALVGALVATAVALAVRRRATLGGAVWAFAALVKWVPLVFFGLVALAARARLRPAGAVGFAVTLAVGAARRDVAIRAPLAGSARATRRQRRSEDELRAPVPARAAGPPPRCGARTGVRRAPRGPRAAGTRRARRPRAARDRRVPRSCDDALPRGLVPRLGSPARGPGGRRSPRAGRGARAHGVPAPADDSALRRKTTMPSSSNTTRNRPLARSAANARPNRVGESA